ncbi:2-oxoglutarate dehydrogenase, E2 component, dihydrolipoamide succinyltransferase, partial [Nocardia farcinica]
MAFSVQMPALGESVTEGTVTRWLKQEGDTVEVDEPLLEVSTDKVDTEIPSPAAGVLSKIVAQEDDVVEVGGELGVISEAGEAPAESAPAAEAPAEESAAAEPEPEPAQAEQAPAQQPAASGDAAEGTPVKMPELGESVTEGTVTRWLKSVGDQVEVDEPLLEVSTDKVDTEIPSPVAGTLLEITAQEDDVVAVGGQLGVIGSGKPAAASAPAPAPAPETKAEPKPEPAPEPKPEPKPEPAPEPKPEPAPKAEQPAPAAQAQPQAPAPADSGATPYVTPLVRKLAEEHGVDLNSIKGSGVGGRIRKQDVLAAAEAKKAPAAAAAPAPAAAAPAAKAPS